MKRIFSIIIVLVIMVSVGVWWRTYQQKSASPTMMAQQKKVVQVARVRQVTFPDRVESVGTLQAEQQVQVSSQIPGQIQQIHYKAGDFVKLGQSLFTLDNRIYKAKLAAAQSNLSYAKADYHRFLTLTKWGAQSKQMLQQSRNHYLQAKANVSTNQTYLSQTNITAPFSGYMGAKQVDVGDYVQAGQALGLLTDRAILRVDYNLPEMVLPDLKTGQTVLVHVPSLKKTFSGIVNFIAPTVNVDTHSVEVQARVPNRDNQLSPGEFVKITQVTGVTRKALVVPQASIVSTITGSKVYVVRDGRAYATDVIVGGSYKNRTEIKKGLLPNAEVVVTGQQQLKDGAPVRSMPWHAQP